MRCEVCGRKIYGKPYRVIIEGAELLVCSECAKLGKIVPESKTKKPMLTKRRLPLKTVKKSAPQTPVETTLELVEDYNVRIREAREKLGITHEDLGKKINEKTSVLKKIETGKMVPDNKLALKLEHALKIKLLTPASTEKIEIINLPKPSNQKLTIGDLIEQKRKETKKNNEGNNSSKA